VAAVLGYGGGEHDAGRLEEATLRAELDGGMDRLSLVLGSMPPPADKPKRGRPRKATVKPSGKRTMSAAGRKAIAAAQRRRWAELRKAARKES
jgi:hypothetical protein